MKQRTGRCVYRPTNTEDCPQTTRSEGTGVEQICPSTPPAPQPSAGTHSAHTWISDFQAPEQHISVVEATQFQLP